MCKTLKKQHYELIADVIWRSGAIPDKNAVRQQARESMRLLIVAGLEGEFKANNSNFDSDKFRKACGL